MTNPLPSVSFSSFGFCLPRRSGAKAGHSFVLCHSSFVIRIDSVDVAHLTFLCLAIAVIAFLYSSVGHAGASGYIATMTLFGLVATEIRPTALVLNILVATIGSVQFWRAAHCSWKLFWPFALLSILSASCVVFLQPSSSVLRILIGAVL